MSRARGSTYAGLFRVTADKREVSLGVDTGGDTFADGQEVLLDPAGGWETFGRNLS